MVAVTATGDSSVNMSRGLHATSQVVQSGALPDTIDTGKSLRVLH